MMKRATAVALALAALVSTTACEQDDRMWSERSEKPGQHGNGVWLPGENIATGEYEVIDGTDCIWVLYEHYQTEVTANGVYFLGERLTVTSDDAVVEFAGDCTWELVEP